MKEAWLMVCLGNICRSPTAEAVVKKIVSEKKLSIQVDSCGTAGYHIGEKADPRTIKHAKARNIDISQHRARQLLKSDFSTYDRIFVMDRSNLKNTLAICPEQFIYKVELFLGEEELIDPWYHGPDIFEKVLDLCMERANILLDSKMR